LMNTHVVFTLAIFYISMILTDWGERNNADLASPQSGSTSMWIQISALWMCQVCYIVSLIMPSFRIFPRSIWDLQPRI
jgi:hypothetical protein